MASSLVVNSYTTPAHAQDPPYSYIAVPRRLPSPPIEEASKCSLPPISALLGLPEGSNPQEQQQQEQRMVDCRPDSREQYRPPPSLNFPGGYPPTPPLQSDSWFDRRQSPSAASNTRHSVVSMPENYTASGSVSAINNTEPHAQRQYVAGLSRRFSMQAESIASRQTLFNCSQCAVSPEQQSMGPYFSSPIQLSPLQSQLPGLYYQRPLPQPFPLSVMPVSITLAPSPSTNPWQHHHYISPSSAADFHQAQERYSCPTCNKSFSRPSSLRIHSHSHTGEKPYMCPHHGCGKTFSVRSNMKRHERGCHMFDGGPMRC